MLLSLLWSCIRHSALASLDTPNSPAMEEIEQVESEYKKQTPKRDLIATLISIQVDLIHNCIISLISPFLVFFSMAFESYHRTQKATAAVESMVAKLPFKVTYNGVALVRKIGLGIVGAVHVFVVLVMVMVLAVLLGVGLVQFWVEEPVSVREKLFFDYTEPNPKAEFVFGGFDRFLMKNRLMGIPVGHTFHVSLMLLMPESDYNRQVGIFQLTAEVLSENGHVMARLSRPCMMQFRSLPIRLARTFLMGVPLILGISEETQKMSVQILNHKEGYPRTKAIRFTLTPRAGTSFLPQFYEAEIHMNSQLPWTKAIVHNWKWAFYVWTSLHIYVMLVIILVFWCRPLLFPLASSSSRDQGQVEVNYEEPNEEQAETTRDEREVSEILKKWQQRRRKRKAILLHRDLAETSSASSITFSREDTSVVMEDDTGDAESVYLGSTG